MKEYKPSVRSVDIKSYRTGNSYIGQEYGIPHTDIPFSVEILLDTVQSYFYYSIVQHQTFSVLVFWAVFCVLRQY